MNKVFNFAFFVVVWSLVLVLFSSAMVAEAIAVDEPRVCYSKIISKEDLKGVQTIRYVITDHRNALGWWGDKQVRVVLLKPRALAHYDDQGRLMAAFGSWRSDWFEIEDVRCEDGDLW